MKMFMERAMALLLVLLLFAILFGVAMVSIWLLEIIHPFLPGVIFGTTVLLVLLYHVFKFIYWLFIEPFKKNKE